MSIAVISTELMELIVTVVLVILSFGFLAFWHWLERKK
jgi:hypothetical protein